MQIAPSATASPESNPAVRAVYTDRSTNSVKAEYIWLLSEKHTLVNDPPTAHAVVIAETAEQAFEKLKQEWSESVKPSGFAFPEDWIIERMLERDPVFILDFGLLR